LLAHEPIRSGALLALWAMAMTARKWHSITMLAVMAKPLRATLVIRFATEHCVNGAATIMGKLIPKLAFKLVMMHAQ